jgi:hypothetical protein
MNLSRFLLTRSFPLASELAAPAALAQLSSQNGIAQLVRGMKTGAGSASGVAVPPAASSPSLKVVGTPSTRLRGFAQAAYAEPAKTDMFCFQVLVVGG